MTHGRLMDVDGQPHAWVPDLRQLRQRRLHPDTYQGHVTAARREAVTMPCTYADERT